MVSSQGFNALLKLVEEPPPHLKFIFATTEPDKVIGTIRSRTHHYPFRLVPPKLLGEYLLSLCESEGVTLEPNALPLVVRAGAGSVRDTLSVLDQLLGGAGPDGVTYDLAVQLLGYTPDSLLDEAIDAFAADDGATVFGVVDKVIESGQDPRRFAEDLLQRLRDLVIVAAVPDALSTGLLEVPGDRAERLRSQAAGFGPSELTRAAEVVNTALVDFRGATAPRLLLELMCARILVPGADHTSLGFTSRLDRLERRLSIDTPPAAEPASKADPAPEVETAPRRRARTGRRAETGCRARDRNRPLSLSKRPKRETAEDAVSAELSDRRRPKRPRSPAASASPTSGGCGPASSTGSRSCGGSPGSCSARTPRSSRWRTTPSRSRWSTPVPATPSSAAARTSTCSRPCTTSSASRGASTTSSTRRPIRRATRHRAQVRHSPTPRRPMLARPERRGVKSPDTVRDAMRDTQARTGRRPR